MRFGRSHALSRATRVEKDRRCRSGLEQDLSLGVIFCCKQCGHTRRSMVLTVAGMVKAGLHRGYSPGVWPTQCHVQHIHASSFWF